MYLYIYLSTYLPIYLSVCLSTYLSICKLENQASLRDVFIVQSWQHQKRGNSARLPQCLPWQRQKRSKSARPLHFQSWQHFKKKRSNSARLPQFLYLTTSKSKQFCKTSLKNGKFSAALTASYQYVLRFFHSTCLKYCACHEKVMPGHTKCCTCHAKSS